MTDSNRDSHVRDSFRLDEQPSFLLPDLWLISMDVVCNTTHDTRRDYSVRLAKFYNAIINNNYAYVEQKILKRCFHVDARDGDFVTPLLLATLHGHIELVCLEFFLYMRLTF